MTIQSKNVISKGNSELLGEHSYKYLYDANGNQIGVGYFVNNDEKYSMALLFKNGKEEFYPDKESVSEIDQDLLRKHWYLP